MVLQKGTNPSQISLLDNLLHDLDKITFLDVVPLVTKLETTLGTLAHLRNLLLAVLD